MLNRKAKDERELLIEQARYLSNPESNRYVSVVSQKTDGATTLQKTQTTNLEVSPFGDSDAGVVSGIRESCSEEAIDDYVTDQGPLALRVLERTEGTKQAAYSFCNSGFPIALPRTAGVNRGSCGPGGTRKSIFAMEMEKRRPSLGLSTAPPAKISTNMLESEGIEYLRRAKPQTVCGLGLGCRSSEVEKIHKENIERLSHMSEEEILKEREDLLQTTDPNIISFLLHKSRKVLPDSNEKKSKRSDEDDDGTKPSAGDYPLKPDPRIPHMDILEKDKLEWTLDLPVVAKKPPAINITTHDGSSGTEEQDDVDMTSQKTDMEVDRVKEAQPSVACQARFDLSGLVVPPDAVVDTHLGLHHHGEEPERAGYTIGELFHLSRSSVPAQRRLALATLASSLIQSRSGRHVPHLAPSSSPSLIFGLMSSDVVGDAASESEGSGGGRGGVAFLLRWCLDESVNALTSAGSAAAGVGGSSEQSAGCAAGISLNLLVECIRGLANLLCDVIGEAFLNASYEWPLEICTGRGFSLVPPSTNQNRSPGLKDLSKFETPTDKEKSRNEIDHCKAMERDPVDFLFSHSQLPRRLAWLLANGAGRARVRLSADAAGIWLPALLIRGVRHSVKLAHKIFSTPELMSTVLENFVPLRKDTSDVNSVGGASPSRPLYLTEAHGVPLPYFVRFCRLLCESSPSIRLSLVNDSRLVERCLSYLAPAPTDQSSSLESLLAGLPRSLPLNVAAQLQIESLRCLSACVAPDLDDDSNKFQSVPLKAFDSICKALDMLRGESRKVLNLYERHFIHSAPARLNTGGVERRLLIELTTAWISFIVRILEALGHARGFETRLPMSFVHIWVQDLLAWLIHLVDHVRKQLHCDNATPTWTELDARFDLAGLSPTLIAVGIDSFVRFLQLRHDLDETPKTPFSDLLTNYWTAHLMPLFTERMWIQIADRYLCNESVFTGSPEYYRDIDLVTVPLWPTAGPEKNSDNDPSSKPPTIDWLDMQPSALIDTGILEPVSLAPECLPDLGATVCFRYRTGEPGLGAFWWPKSSSFPTEDSLTSASGQNSSLSRSMPIVGSILSTFEHLLLNWRYHLMESIPMEPMIPLINLVNRFAHKRLLSWINDSTLGGKRGTKISPPCLLTGMESELIGRAVLLLAQISSHQCPFSSTLKTMLCSKATGNSIHCAALRLLPFLRSNQVQLLRRLLVEVIFVPDQIDLYLNICDAQYSEAPELHRIAEMYVRDLVGKKKDITTSVQTPATNSGRTGLQSIPESMDESADSVVVGPPPNLTRQCGSLATALVPHDWAYTPLVSWYVSAKLRVNTGLGEPSDSENEQILSELTRCLHWLMFLSRIQSDTQTSNSMRSFYDGVLDPLSHFARLCTGCLAYSGAGGLGFGNSGVLLAKLLHAVGPISKLALLGPTDRLLERVDLPHSCASFYDLYTDLLGHYAALSYNSPIFANLILWPCQAQCHMKYRRALWSEYQHALIAVRLRLDQLLLPLRSFLEPEETDESVLRTYAAAILSGGIRVNRQPLLFLIAVHHLNRFLYSTANSSTAFTKQFARILTVGSLNMGREKAGVHSHPGEQQAQVLDLICRYKQPQIGWMEGNPKLLIDSEIKTGVNDPLIQVDPVLKIAGDTPCDGSQGFWDHVSLAGIEYYELDQLPARRKAYWERHFTQS
ncbi:unnamed protein product [Calicophoron daubneyi]|uniref:RNA polymerase II-associated protein 1 n=1 Tax=Calicophoron daubneyi TaxID=300641 RepID=A0AAV2TW53_CALDB